MVASDTKWLRKGVLSKLFYGEYNHTIDQKGRVILPSGFRENLGDKFMVAKWLDDCLSVFPASEWDKIQEKIASQPSTALEIRKFSRMFFAGAGELQSDKQGRVVIPTNLRDYASLDKDIVVVGVSSRIEIWDKQKWLTYNESDDMNMSDMANKLSELGI